MLSQLMNSLFRRWLFWSLVVALFIAGGCFRLVGLNDTSLHSDGIFHDVCKSGASPIDILVKWEQMVGWTSQLATPAAFTKLFLDIFHLAPTRGNVILPSALWGLLTTIAALWVGWKAGGRWFGLLLMAVVTLNPAHIQLSRTAYFYLPCMFGDFVMLWCLLEAWEHMKAGRRLPWTFHMIQAGGFAIFIYSTASAWFLASVFGLSIVVLSIIKWKRGQVGINEVFILAGTYLVVGAPLLFVPWGVEALLRSKSQSQYTDYWKRIFELQRSQSMWVTAFHEISRLCWGWTPLRLSLMGLTAGFGVVVMGLRARRDVRWSFPILLFGMGLLLFFSAMRDSAFFLTLRRVSAIWPFAFIILAAGLAAPWLIDVSKRWRTMIRVVWGALVFLSLGLWVNTDFRVLNVNGFPIPYQRIGQWVDSHFPKGTPVVTDRFYTAMCEFNQAHPTTNVVIISTVPNELPEIQEKTRFRDVTRQYFEDNPDAAFYCAGHLYDRPEVVRWEWAEQYFKCHKEFRDDHAAALSLIGQGYADYPGTIRWPVLYYNTVEDMAAIKRAKGAVGFVFWGPEWRPVQTQDYRLWRLLLAGDAGLKVYGLGTNEQAVALELTGVAVGGDQRVQVGDQAMTFPANQIVQHRVKVKVQPGMNVVPVRSRGAANARLLFAKAEVK